MMAPETLPPEFWSKVERTDTCWLWTGAKNQFGYGIFRLNRVARSAHRIVIDAPKGQYVDHMCHVTNCVNPDHLQVVTNRQNVENRGGLNANNTSGVRGVSWSEDRQRWVVNVRSNYRTRFGGRYASLAEAEAAAVALRNELMTNNLGDRREACRCFKDAA